MSTATPTNATSSHTARNIRGIAVAITLLFLAATAQAQSTWYVRTTGNNAHAGNTPASAVATLTGALNKASAGDTIYIGAGTYAGQTTININSQANAPLRIIADTTGQHTGDAGTVTLSHQWSVVNVKGQAVRFENITFTSSGNSDLIAWESANNGYVKGCTFINGSNGIGLFSGAQAEIVASTFSGQSAAGISVQDGNMTVRTSTFTNCTTGVHSQNNNTVRIERCMFTGGTKGAHIENGNAQIIACVFSTISGSAITSQDASPVSIINCTFYTIAGHGIDSQNGNITSKNNIFSVISGDCQRRQNANFTTSHNIFHQFTGERSRGFDDGQPYWVVNPKFVSPGSGDLRLRDDSPALNVGMDASSFGMLDYDGVIRPQGDGWDVGAFETLAAGAVPADTPYFTAFDDDAGPEWTNNTITTYAKHGHWLGPFQGEPGNKQPVELHLNVEQGVPYVLLFDLLLIDSWDGTDPNPAGPDTFTIDIAGLTLFEESFNNHNTIAKDQSYPNTAHYYGNIANNPQQDAIYRDLRVDFVPGATRIVITFASNVTHSDERFAIDNIRVAKLDDSFENIPLFIDHTDHISFHLPTDPDSSYAQGWAWADINNNGLLDGLASGNNAAWLFRNDAQTITVSPLHAGDYSGQIALLDIDSDGDLDLWTKHQQVFENLGNSTFVPAGSWSFGGAAGRSAEAAIDINADGLTDIIAIASSGAIAGYQMQGETKLELAEGADIGINILGGQGLAATADANDNGRLDIYYSRTTGLLYLSQGDGTYHQDNRGIAQTLGHNRTVGAAWADTNNSGRMDLLAPHPDATGGVALWINSGQSFSNIAESAALPTEGRFRSAAWGDVNNNGHLDLYLTAELEDEPNVLYINNGDGTFTRRDWGTGLYGKAIDATFVDIDNDGDLDLVLTFENGQTRFLRNTLNDNNSLSVQAIGRGRGGTPTDAAGLRIDLLDAAAQTLLARRTIGNARGFGTEPFRAHFGGTNPATHYTVRVHFQSGPVDTHVRPQDVSTTFGHRTVQRLLQVTEPPGAPRMVRWLEETP